MKIEFGSFSEVARTAAVLLAEKHPAAFHELTAIIETMVAGRTLKDLEHLCELPKRIAQYRRSAEVCFEYHGRQTVGGREIRLYSVTARWRVSALFSVSMDGSQFETFCTCNDLEAQVSTLFPDLE